MTNRIAIFLGLFIVLAILLDVFLFDSANLVFLAKKFTELIEWIAFWR